MEPARIQPDILILGDTEEAFWDCTELQECNIELCGNIEKGIEKASSNNYRIVYIVMSSFNGNLESTLYQIRRSSENTRLVLLSQMYEEPVARQMLKSFRRPENPADEYFICPVAARSLIRHTESEGHNKTAAVPEKKQQTAAPAEEKIRPADDKTTLLQDIRIRELEKLATEDDLTGLKNRRYVWEFLRQILVRAKAEDFNATLLVFDIDNFKHYNDAYGHAVGDNVLVQTATMMRRCRREHDIVARIGGDEFAVVFWDRPETQADAKQTAEAERRSKQHNKHPEEAIFIAERFRKEMNATDLCMLGTDGKGTLTISGGLASFPRDGMTADQLFEKADEAMMEAKRSGKNRIYLVGRE